MEKIIIDIDTKTGDVETTLMGNSKLTSDVMYAICEALLNMNGAKHIYTELDIRKI